jgi:hypothetical protein
METTNMDELCITHILTLNSTQTIGNNLHIDDYHRSSITTTNIPL